MQWRRLVLVTWVFLLAVACATDPNRKYEMEAAPSFLFEEHPFHFECTDRWPGQPLPPGTHAWLTVSPQIPYSYGRLETLDLPQSQIPALTLAAENGAYLDLSIQGETQHDWRLKFCARGEGNGEAEARGYLNTVSMSRMGSLVTLDGGSVGPIGPGGPPGGRGQLVVDAPADAPVTVDSSAGPIAVHDMAGPVRLAAAQARITVLNTTGTVDATGGVVDFAGSKGTVMLTASMETDVKLTARRFEGQLSAYASREARVLIPEGFQTPVELIVSRKKDLICRADICKNMQQKRNISIYISTFAGDGSATDHVRIRSEFSTVVVDNIPNSPWERTGPLREHSGGVVQLGTHDGGFLHE